MEELLAQKEKCCWSIKIQLFEDKWHFLQYAGRYVRRPPIAQRRITWIGERNVGFWFKDKKLRRRVEVQCSLEEFVDRWAQHIPERYQHAVHSFGLFAPRALQANLGGHFSTFPSVRLIVKMRVSIHQYRATERRESIGALYGSLARVLSWRGFLSPRPLVQGHLEDFLVAAEAKD